MQKIFGLAGLALLVTAFLTPGTPATYTGGMLFFGAIAVLILAWLGPDALLPSFRTGSRTAHRARAATEDPFA